MNPLAKASGKPIFDPTGHEGNLLQAFQNYLDSWEMWYDVACLNDLSADANAALRNEHKAKVFRMCAFQGEKHKNDLKFEYNQDISALKLASFDDMITKIQNRYKPTQNQVLLHYQFHQLRQHPGEKIDAFINKVQLHADQCAFKCQNQGCTDKNAIHNSLIRDQILIGTNMPLLRTTALDKEHDLQATWIVVDKMDLKGNPSNLLSCKLAESLGIITFHSPQSSIHAISTQNTAFQSLQKAVTPDIADILSKYSPVFDGLGKLNADPITLHLDPDAKPIIQPPRPIPFHLQQEFNKVIASMEQEDVIEQHYGPVTWLSNPPCS